MAIRSIAFLYADSMSDLTGAEHSAIVCIEGVGVFKWSDANGGGWVNTVVVASSTAPGLMSIADKGKVDGLASRIYVEGTLSGTAKVSKRTVTSDANGGFTCTFSTEGFAAGSAPGCTAQAQASGTGIANTVNATTLAPTFANGAWTVTGWVSAPNTQTLLGLTTTAPVKVAPSITVIVTAIGN